MQRESETQPVSLERFWTQSLTGHKVSNKDFCDLAERFWMIRGSRLQSKMALFCALGIFSIAAGIVLDSSSYGSSWPASSILTILGVGFFAALFSNMPDLGQAIRNRCDANHVHRATVEGNETAQVAFEVAGLHHRIESLSAWAWKSKADAMMQFLRSKGIDFVHPKPTLAERLFSS